MIINHFLHLFFLILTCFIYIAAAEINDVLEDGPELLFRGGNKRRRPIERPKVEPDEDDLEELLRPLKPIHVQPIKPVKINEPAKIIEPVNIQPVKIIEPAKILQPVTQPKIEPEVKLVTEPKIEVVRTTEVPKLMTEAKTEPPIPVELPKETLKPVESPKPADSLKPAELPKPAEPIKLNETQSPPAVQAPKKQQHDEEYIVETVQVPNPPPSSSGIEIDDGDQSSSSSSDYLMTPVSKLTIEQLDRICQARAVEKGLINPQDVETWLQRLSRALSSISSVLVSQVGVKEGGGESIDGLARDVNNTSNLTSSLSPSSEINISVADQVNTTSIKPVMIINDEPKVEIKKSKPTPISRLGQALAQAASQIGVIVRGFVAPSAKSDDDEDEGYDDEDEIPALNETLNQKKGSRIK